MAGEWFYMQDGQQYGPCSSAHLKALVASGQVQRTDLVWKEGMAQWMAAERLSGLFPANRPVPTPVSPARSQPQATDSLAALAQMSQPSAARSSVPRPIPRKAKSSAPIFLVAGVVAIIVVGVVALVVYLGNRSGTHSQQEAIAAARQGEQKITDGQSQLTNALAEGDKIRRQAEDDARQRPTVPKIEIPAVPDIRPPASETGRRLPPTGTEVAQTPTPSKPAASDQFDESVSTGKPRISAGHVEVATPIASIPYDNDKYAINDLRFTSDGSRLRAGWSGHSRLWYLTVDTTKWTPEAAAPKWESEAPSPDGRLTIDRSGVLSIRSSQSAQKKLATFPIISNAFGAAAAVGWMPQWAADSKTLVLVTGGASGSGTDIVIVNVASTPKSIGRFRIGLEPLWSAVCVAPNAKYLAAVDRGNIVIHALPSGKEAARLTIKDQVDDDHGIAYGFSPDSTRFVAMRSRQKPGGEQERCLCIWTTDGWELVVAVPNSDVRYFDGDKSPVNFKYRTFSPDSRLVVTSAGSVARETTVNVWDAATGKKACEFFSPVVHSVCFSGDGKHIMTAGPNDEIPRFLEAFADLLTDAYIWDASTGLLKVRIKGRGILAAAYHPKTSVVVTSGIGLKGEIKVWDLTKSTPADSWDIFEEYRLFKKNENAKLEALRRPAGPITKEMYAAVRRGMESPDVIEVCKGQGKMQVEHFSEGLHWGTVVTMTYSCQGGGTAVFVLEGLSKPAGVVKKSNSAGW